MHFPKKSKQQICFYKSKMLFMNRLCLRLSCAKQTQRSESGSGFLCHVWMAEQPNFHITYSHSTFLRTQVCSFGQLPHFPLSLHLQSCSVPFPLLSESEHTGPPHVFGCANRAHRAALRTILLCWHLLELLKWGCRDLGPGEHQTPLELQWGRGPSTSALPGAVPAARHYQQTVWPSGPMAGASHSSSLSIPLSLSPDKWVRAS